ncbi:eukaryotic translation initiation factor 4 gamma [Anaeramoeba flamelloides]|uniref:Eukaryotic translation initiation factor 4 gamma n=1 Tax=Anaeramoeba flamelloides TaxID=1746091 RepID=A0AAV7Z3T1_9EUKA|nr:eukaryotic translation initiation factor 4 gamma [Anaeramoeba flamelloides]
MLRSQKKIPKLLNKLVQEYGTKKGNKIYQSYQSNFYSKDLNKTEYLTIQELIQNELSITFDNKKFLVCKIGSDCTRSKFLFLQDLSASINVTLINPQSSLLGAVCLILEWNYVKKKQSKGSNKDYLEIDGNKVIQLMNSKEYYKQITSIKNIYSINKIKKPNFGIKPRLKFTVYGMVNSISSINLRNDNKPFLIVEIYYSGTKNFVLIYGEKALKWYPFLSIENKYFFVNVKKKLCMGGLYEVLYFDEKSFLLDYDFKFIKKNKESVLLKQNQQEHERKKKRKQEKQTNKEKQRNQIKKRNKEKQRKEEEEEEEKDEEEIQQRNKKKRMNKKKAQLRHSLNFNKSSKPKKYSLTTKQFAIFQPDKKPNKLGKLDGFKTHHKPIKKKNNNKFFNSNLLKIKGKLKRDKYQNFKIWKINNQYLIFNLFKKGEDLIPFYSGCEIIIYNYHRLDDDNNQMFAIVLCEKSNIKITKYSPNKRELNNKIIFLNKLVNAYKLLNNFDSIGKIFWFIENYKILKEKFKFLKKSLIIKSLARKFKSKRNCVKEFFDHQNCCKVAEINLLNENYLIFFSLRDFLWNEQLHYKISKFSQKYHPKSLIVFSHQDKLEKQSFSNLSLIGKLQINHYNAQLLIYDDTQKIPILINNLNSLPSHYILYSLENLIKFNNFFIIAEFCISNNNDDDLDMNNKFNNRDNNNNNKMKIINENSNNNNNFNVIKKNDNINVNDDSVEIIYLDRFLVINLCLDYDLSPSLSLPNNNNDGGNNTTTNDNDNNNFNNNNIIINNNNNNNNKEIEKENFNNLISPNNQNIQNKKHIMNMNKINLIDNNNFKLQPFQINENFFYWFYLIVISKTMITEQYENNGLFTFFKMKVLCFCFNNSLKDFTTTTELQFSSMDKTLYFYQLFQKNNCYKIIKPKKDNLYNYEINSSCKIESICFKCNSDPNSNSVNFNKFQYKAPFFSWNIDKKYISLLFKIKISTFQIDALDNIWKKNKLDINYLNVKDLLNCQISDIGIKHLFSFKGKIISKLIKNSSSSSSSILSQNKININGGNTGDTYNGNENETTAPITNNGFVGKRNESETLYQIIIQDLKSKDIVKVNISKYFLIQPIIINTIAYFENVQRIVHANKTFNLKIIADTKIIFDSYQFTPKKKILKLQNIDKFSKINLVDNLKISYLCDLLKQYPTLKSDKCIKIKGNLQLFYLSLELEKSTLQLKVKMSGIIRDPSGSIIIGINTISVFQILFGFSNNQMLEIKNCLKKSLEKKFTLNFRKKFFHNNFMNNINNVNMNININSSSSNNETEYDNNSSNNSFFENDHQNRIYYLIMKNHSQTQNKFFYFCQIFKRQDYKTRKWSYEQNNNISIDYYKKFPLEHGLDLKLTNTRIPNNKMNHTQEFKILRYIIKKPIVFMVKKDIDLRALANDLYKEMFN